MNPNLFSSATIYPPTSPFGILQFEGQGLNANAAAAAAVAAVAAGSAAALAAGMNSSNSSNHNLITGNNVTSCKRKLTDDDDSQESYSNQSHSANSNVNSNEPQRDKRLRTTILPEQLDYLYQKYQIESNPSRKMLENIAKEVGLKKRVVQVWFQNTRARERKGQFRAHQQVIHKRCPFCRALFKARSALESHLATRHADQYTKGDINIDALPDGEPDDINDVDSIKNSLPSEILKLNSQFYDAKFLQKYMDEAAATSSTLDTSSAGATGLTPELALTLQRAAFEAAQSQARTTATTTSSASGGRSGSGETTAPLDLSKPVDLSRSFESFASRFGRGGDDNGFESRSEDASDSESENEGNDDMMSGPNSPAPGSTTSSVTSPTGLTGNGQLNLSSTPSNNNNNSNSNSTANKRFRTQMTTVQLKVMKSIFAEYTTPSMAECDALGREVGLQKRVVQVWFQNARAKKKKAGLQYQKQYGQEMPDSSLKPPEECKVCGVKYNLRFSSTSPQDHLFSKKHIENLKNHIDSVKKVTGNTGVPGSGMECADDTVDFPGAASIVMPTNTNSSTTPSGGSGDESDHNSSSTGQRTSSSASNLIQQLQMMGMAGLTGLQPGLISVNGDASKSVKGQPSWW